MPSIALVAACIALLLTSSSVSAFKFTRCGGNNDINVQLISLEPDIISLPGRITLGFAGKIQQPFRNIDMKMDLVRKTWLGNIRIPCLFNIGSCTYPDLCNLLDRMEREDWVGISARIAAEIRQLIASVDSEGLHACPFERAELEIADRTLDLPSIPSLLAVIASGDYKIRIELNNSDTRDLMSCFEMEMTLKKGD